jgi:hypothetical protein
MADTPQKQQHHHHHHTDAEKEKRRKKALRRMGKIITKAWELSDAEPFQSYNGHHTSYSGGSAAAATAAAAAVLCLTTLGQKVDEERYSYGKHGWEDFARDIGGIYNRHQQRYVVALFIVISPFTL